MQRLMYISETHEAWLPEDNFPLVAMINRFPRYVNKRIMDPQLKCFVDENNYEVPPEWGIPKPNPVAAYKSLAKYGKDIPCMTEEQVNAMNAAWSYTARQFGVYMNESDIITLEESIAKMNRASSSGSPFNQIYKTKGELFDNDNNIRAWLENDWERLATDPKWSCLFTNSLKEELRTEEKIAENSQRTFLAGGADATIHGTRLFSDMNEKMYASHIVTASAIGVSPYKGNWDTLYRKLSIFSKGYALDESQYDSSLRTYMMWGCAQFRWNMLRADLQTEANLNRLRTYYRNLVHTLVITPEGVIVMKRTGNPSGSVNTISDNTLILYTLLAYAWILNVPENLRSYANFELHTAKALVGDDNTWTVSDEAHPYYNAYTVIDQWKVIGVTTTTDSMEPRNPRDLDFLSAHTVFLDGLAVPIYSRVKMMSTLLYAPKNHLTPSTTLQRVAALLSVGWIDPVFRKFCRHAIAWLLEKYDHIMYEEPTWILAKCQILTDAHYYRLFTGQRKYFVLPAQSCNLEGPVKLTQPNKNNMSTARARKNGTKPGKKTRMTKGKRGPRPRKVGRTRKANVGKTKVVVIGKPRQRMLPNGNLLVAHREFIGKVPGSVNFSITTDAINPGLPQQFKWLYPIAMRYESYVIRRLTYEFINSKAGTFAGDVIMGVDYDPSDPAPFNEDELQTYFGCKTSQICEPMRFTADPKMLHKIGPSKFTRIGGLSANQDIKLYDSGNFFIATTDCADTSNIGRLFVEYEIELMTPQVSAADILSESIAVIAESAAAPLGTGFVQTGTMSLTWLSGTTFSVDVPGQYIVTMVCVGTVITSAVAISAAASPSLQTVIFNLINGGSTSAVSQNIIKVNSATDVFTVAVTATTITSTVIRVAPYTYANA